MRQLRNTVFTTANGTYMKDYVENPKELQRLVEEAQDSYLTAFNKLFVKDLLIKLIAGLVKESASTYHDESASESSPPLDYSTLTPTATFLSLASHLHELLDSRTGTIDLALGLNEERNVFLGLVAFKDRLLLFIVRRLLEVLRDVLILLPLSAKAKALEENKRFKCYSEEFKEYIDKIVVERRFTARFVTFRGQQHLMFGIWYLVLSFTPLIQTAEVRKS